MARGNGAPRVIHDATLPRASYAPDSTADLSGHLAHAMAEAKAGRAVTQGIVGAGTWGAAGHPHHAEQRLSMARVAGIVDYVPGDLTLTARAGTPLSHLDDITRREGQWLAVDPAGNRNGTIGATVATAAAGPLSLAFGRMRDLVLGLEVVSGAGVVSRAGGRVVKNVAGFDLVRLQVGAWGTLGVISEVSVRLRALPEVETTCAVALDARTSLTAHLVKLRELTLSPLALELLGPALTTRLGLGEAHAWLVRLGGNAERVRFQQELLATVGDVVEVDQAVWRALATLETPGCAVARLSHLPMQVATLWAHAHETVTMAGLSPCLAHAMVHRGTMRLVIPHANGMSGDEFAAACASIAQQVVMPGGHVVWEQLPSAAWSAVPCLVRDHISVGLRRAFDPELLLNRGLLGESRIA